MNLRDHFVQRFYTFKKFACKFNLRLQTSDSRLEPLCGSTAKGVLHETCNTPLFLHLDPVFPDPVLEILTLDTQLFGAAGNVPLVPVEGFLQ